jgi:predicted nucleic acid-binding protein
VLVVADTSPLNYLVWIELAEILPKLYGTVIIPHEVRDELVAPDAPPVVSAWARDLPDWIEVKPVAAALRDDSRWASLDVGERAALALASTMTSAVLLIDERAGSTIARSFGLPVMGTLGVLDEAARRRLISLPDAIERLKGDDSGNETRPGYMNNVHGLAVDVETGARPAAWPRSIDPRHAPVVLRTSPTRPVASDRLESGVGGDATGAGAALFERRGYSTRRARAHAAIVAASAPS